MLLSEVLSCNSMHEDYGKQIPKFSVFFLPKMHIFAKKKKKTCILDETVMLRLHRLALAQAMSLKMMFVNVYDG